MKHDLDNANNATKQLHAALSAATTAAAAERAAGRADRQGEVDGHVATIAIRDAEIVKLKQSINDRDAEIVRLTKLINDHNVEIGVLRASATSVPDAAQKILQARILAEQAKSAKAVSDRLRDQRKAAKAIADITDENTKYIKQLRDNSIELTALTKKTSELNVDLLKCNAVIAVAKDEVQQLKRENTSLKRVVHSSTSATANGQNYIAKINTLEQFFVQLTTENDTLSRSISSPPVVAPSSSSSSGPPAPASGPPPPASGPPPASSDLMSQIRAGTQLKKAQSTAAASSSTAPQPTMMDGLRQSMDERRMRVTGPDDDDNDVQDGEWSAATGGHEYDMNTIGGALVLGGGIFSINHVARAIPIVAPIVITMIIISEANAPHKTNERSPPIGLQFKHTRTIKKIEDNKPISYCEQRAIWSGSKQT